MKRSRLPSMKPRLLAPVSVLRPATGDEAERTRFRAKSHPYRAWYNTARWQKLRWQVLKDAAFICAMCGKAESDTSKLVCDHIKPHRGDERLFWDRANLQCIDKACHDGEKQRREKREAWQ